MNASIRFNSASPKELDMFANKQALKFMGAFALPTVLIGAVIIGSYILTIWSMMSGSFPLWAGLISTSVLTYGAYTILHDTVHGSINGKNKSLKWVNDGFGYLAGQLLGVSFIAHQQEHLAHHRHTNVEGKDPDLYVDDDSLWSLIKGTLRVLPLQYKYYFKYSWPNVKTWDKVIVIVELMLMIAWRAALFLAGFWQVGLVVLASTFIGVFALVVLFVWIVHRPHKTSARYENTTTFVFPRGIDTIISWLWLFQNYHSIHHLFPRVPFYEYRELFNAIEPVMIAKNAPIVRVGGRDRS